MKIVQPDRPIFIYRLLSPDDLSVRYIGQSVDPERRLISHLCEARSGYRSHRANWLRKLLVQDMQPILEIIEQATVETWIEREQHWITFYRAEGCRLVNATDGGEGTLGMVPSDETRAKMSAVRKRRPRNPESVRKMAETQRGRKMSLEIVERRYERYTVMAPNGDQIEIEGLAPFCRRHGLDPFSFENVFTGRSRHQRGWQIRRVDDTRPFYPLEDLKGLPYIVTSPEGEHHLVTNLTRWCEERGVKRADLQWSEKRKAAMGGWQMRRAVWLEDGWQIPEDWERWPEFVPDMSYSDERKARLAERMIGEGNPFYGRQHSEETRAKIRAKAIGRPSANARVYILISPSGQQSFAWGLPHASRETGAGEEALTRALKDGLPTRSGWRIRRLE